jgi:peroxiredoxin
MKTKLVVIASAALLFAACQTGTNYTISGTAPFAQEGDSIELSLVEGRNFESVAKAPIENGKFIFKGQTDTCQMAVLLVGGRPMAQLFLEEGDIKVDLSEDEAANAIGTLNNNRMELFNTILKDFYDEYGKLAEKAGAENLNDEDKASLKEQMDAVEKNFEAAVKSGVADNADSHFGRYILLQYSYNFQPEELAPILEEYGKNFPGDEAIARMKENNDKVLNTSVGKKFIDFEMPDPEGNNVKLSDFIAQNKFTLVDFWASWCGPCRQEMPAVKAAYEAFKKKGFGIVGVSLDKDAEAWKKSITELGITWPQMSDLKAWECAGAALYGVRAIPATVLVAQDGTIVARDLRGEAIAEKLTELLGGK